MGLGLQSGAGSRPAGENRGLAGWLLERFASRARRRPRLELVERIALAPRQSLALIEAEGRRFLVASSPEGSPAFYPPDGAVARPEHGARPRRTRVSW